MALRIKGNTSPPTEDLPVEEAEPELPEQAEAASEPAMMPMAGGGTVDPAVARYLGPESRCAGCIHFMDPGSCEIVAGPIDPQGVCVLWTPDQMLEEASLTEPDEAVDGISNLPADNA
jgi:hypothetical protein